MECPRRSGRDVGNIWERVDTAAQEEVGEARRRVRQLTKSIEGTRRQLLHLASLLGRAVEEPDEDLSLLQRDRLLRERPQQLQLEERQGHGEDAAAEGRRDHSLLPT